ncbi:alpha-amylase, partial [Candidatus Saccharibacteria bacterium]|nr:alpha-amylase [Candidatus Saccharibacteria bacterium]
MRAICLYLHMHQPMRYREYSAFDIGQDHNYYTDTWGSRECNERIFKKVAAKSYAPMLGLLHQKMREHPDFKVSLSITGTWLEQAERW